MINQKSQIQGLSQGTTIKNEKNQKLADFFIKNKNQNSKELHTKVKTIYKNRDCQEQQFQKIADQLMELIEIAKDEAYMQYCDYVRVQQYGQKFIYIFKYITQIQFSEIRENQQITLHPKNHQSKYKNQFDSAKELQMSHNFEQTRTKNAHPRSQSLQYQCSLQQINIIKFVCQKTGIHKNGVTGIMNLVLVWAKCYYLQNQYQKCVIFIKKYLPFSRSMSYKIFYQRSILLLKAIYLSFYNDKPEQFLRQTIEQYLNLDNQCFDFKQLNKEQLQVYRMTVQEIYAQVYEGIYIVYNYEVTGDQLKMFQKLVQLCVNKQVKIFQGIPVYLISHNWIKNCIKYLKNTKEQRFPGPIYNFQLQNHIFQFERHPRDIKDKLYMDDLLFPTTQYIDYYYCDSKLWGQLKKQIGGTAIKRFPIADQMISQRMENILIKTIIEIQNKSYLIQWQNGAHWQHSVLPYMYKKFLGEGQLKRIHKKRNKNNQIFRQLKLIEPGIITDCSDHYKYIYIKGELIKKIPYPILNELRLKYDLEQFNFSNKDTQQFSKCILGVNRIKQAGTSDRTKNQYQKLESSKGSRPNQTLANFRNACLNYLAPIIISLLNITQFSQLFINNRFVSLLNLNQKNKQQSLYIYLCFSFADLAKRMWFSDSFQDAIEINVFYQNFIKIINQETYPLQTISLSNDKEKKENQKSKKTVSHYELLQNLLLSLHYLMNCRPQQTLYSTTQVNKIKSLESYNSIDHLITYGSAKFVYTHNSPLLQIFKQFHYKLYECPICECPLLYKFVPSLFMNVDVIEYYEYLKAFFVYYQTGKSHQQKSDLPQSCRQFTYVRTIEQSTIKQNCFKIVQQVTFKLQKSRNVTMSQIYNLLKQRFDQKSKEQEKQFISVIIDDQMKDFQQIHSSLQTNKKDLSIKKVNLLLNRNLQKNQENPSKNKLLLFIFLISSPSQLQQLVLINYRNVKTQKNISFPEVVKFQKSKLYQNQYQKLKQQIKSKLSYSDISLLNYQIYPKSSPSLANFNIKLWISVFTDANIGAEGRSRNKIIIQQNQKDKIEGGSEFVTLMQCLENAYSKKSQFHQNKSENYKEKNEQSPELQTVHCFRCKKKEYPIVQTKLIQIHKIIMIVLNRKPINSSFRITTLVKFPIKGLNMSQFSNEESKNNSKAFMYNLKAVILCYSKVGPIQQNQKLNRKLKYGCIARNSVNGRWYYYENEDVRQIKIEQFDLSTAQILFYERESTNYNNKL